MKRYFLYLPVLLLALAACDKNTYTITDRQGVEGKALVKLGLFNMTTVATPVLIYNNGERISSAVAAPYPFPGSGYNTNGPVANNDYFAINPGENKFDLYTTNTGTINLTSLFFTTTQTFEANKKYTVYTTDTAANAIAIVTPDDAVAPDSGFVNARFINLIPNSPGVDFYKGNTLLKSNIKYKEFTEFTKIAASTADSFSIRPAGAAPGSALSATAYYRLTLNTNQRIISIASRGYIGAVDAVRIPKVSVIVNQ